MCTLDESYYEPALISYLMKIGTIKQPKPEHSNPVLFNLTLEDSVKLRLKYLKNQRQELESEYSAVKCQYLQGKREFAYITLGSIQNKIDKLNKNIYFLKARLKPDNKTVSYDLEALKRIPLDRICRINSNNFFQTNPFRTEKEPSNSLHWDKRTNRWFDFATGKHGDACDLYMAVNSVDFKTACKEMQSL